MALYGSLRLGRTRDLKYAKWQTVRVGVPKYGHSHVINRDTAFGPPFRAPMMRMTVEDNGQSVAVQWLFEPAGPQEGKNFRRFALDGRLNGSVMEQGDALRRVQPCQRGLQLEGFIDRLM